MLLTRAFKSAIREGKLCEQTENKVHCEKKYSWSGTRMSSNLTVHKRLIIQYSKKLKEILDSNVSGISKIRRFYRQNGDFTGF